MKQKQKKNDEREFTKQNLSKVVELLKSTQFTYNYKMYRVNNFIQEAAFHTVC